MLELPRPNSLSALVKIMGLPQKSYNFNRFLVSSFSRGLTKVHDFQALKLTNSTTTLYGDQKITKTTRLQNGVDDMA